MKSSAERNILLLGALLLGLAGCSTANKSISQSTAPEAAPFGGAGKAQIPPEAAAMGNFLKAQVAMNAGDHDEALKDYELAAQADPSSSKLRVKLATLYVRQGKTARGGNSFGDRPRFECRGAVQGGPQARSEEPGSLPLSWDVVRQAGRQRAGRQDL